MRRDDAQRLAQIRRDYGISGAVREAENGHIIPCPRCGGECWEYDLFVDGRPRGRVRSHADCQLDEDRTELPHRNPAEPR